VNLWVLHTKCPLENTKQKDPFAEINMSDFTGSSKNTKLIKKKKKQKRNVCYLLLVLGTVSELNDNRIVCYIIG
jgi:hypothetical protein